LDKQRFTLGLRLPTDPRWASIAGMNLRDILIDHAWCEQKAASSGISLIVNHSDKVELVKVMTEVVAEEWRHFELVMTELRRHNFEFGPPRNDEYVSALMKLEMKGGSKAFQLQEKLLLNALIEARSCERFKTLSEQIEDAYLSDFYYQLMISEAGHYKVLLDLAKLYNPEQQVLARWDELLKKEAEIISSLGIRSDRIH
jgi:tRNA-(ms[2]io[6]A)-hydroxylase